MKVLLKGVIISSAASDLQPTDILIDNGIIADIGSSIDS